MKKSDSFLIVEQLIQKRLLVIDPAGLMTWLNNLENTGQITGQEHKNLLRLAEHLDIYNVHFTEHSFMLLHNNLYLHPSMLSPDPIASTQMGIASMLAAVKNVQ